MINLILFQQHCYQGFKMEKQWYLFPILFEFIQVSFLHIVCMYFFFVVFILKSERHCVIRKCEVLGLIARIGKQKKHSVVSLDISNFHFTANRWGRSGSSERLYFLGLQVTTAGGDCSHEIKRHLLLERKAMTNLDSILKSRDINHFVNKSPSSQSYGFSSSHVWM